MQELSTTITATAAPVMLTPYSTRTVITTYSSTAEVSAAPTQINPDGEIAHESGIGISTGAKVAIILGAIAAAGLWLLAGTFVWRWLKRKKTQTNESTGQEAETEAEERHELPDTNQVYEIPHRVGFYNLI